MDRELIRGIIRYIAANRNKKVTVKNYNQADIKKTIADLLEQEVITEGTTLVESNSSLVQNLNIRNNTTIPEDPNAKRIEIYYINESVLKECYGMDKYGNDIIE